MSRAMSRETVLGRIAIEERDGFIVRLSLPGEDTMEEWGGGSPLLEAAFAQLGEYLEGRRQGFELPLAPQGTCFMQSVWAELRKIPYGRTVSYRDIAVSLGNSRAVRAVGMANHRNPIAIVIPCHRVIGADGSLVGYAGGLEMKRRLLDLEQRNVPFHLL